MNKQDLELPDPAVPPGYDYGEGTYTADQLRDYASRTLRTLAANLNTNMSILQISKAQKVRLQAARLEIMAAAAKERLGDNVSVELDAGTWELIASVIASQLMPNYADLVPSRVTASS